MPPTPTTGMNVGTTDGYSRTGPDPQTPVMSKKLKLSTPPPVMCSTQSPGNTGSMAKRTATFLSPTKSGSGANASIDEISMGKENALKVNSKSCASSMKLVAPLPTASSPELPLLHPKVQMKIDLLTIEVKKGIPSWTRFTKF